APLLGETLGHINNQYNTCFWMLVKSAKSEQELQLALKGTFAKDKNELLAQQFQINYDDEPAMFRKGCSVYREKVQTAVKIDDYGEPIKRPRLQVTAAHAPLLGETLGHINNQYNTCFWMLVKSAKSEQELQLALKGTFAKDKNELLAQQFQINYDDEPAMFRKGCSVYREKVMLQMYKQL
ncbi:tRNA(His) guanylyltransferase 1-like, partial [Miscanthus floridulus]|uniref:tRNA(His) guanylyltransferase 1-like n=1 Tax=Miscanthus floridulus TaxID=154761 RepID=UPI003459E4AF